MAADPFASVPPLPPQYQSRPDVEAAHREMLLRGSGAVALTAGFDGPAGVGKTTLAKVMCHDREVRRRFADGIHWVPVGRERRGDDALAALAASLGVPAASCPATVSARLEGRRTLLVLDDVWSSEQVDAFAGLIAGDGGLLATLLTTRNAELASSRGGECLRLERLSDKASLRMLCSFIGDAARPAGEDSDVLLRACRGNAAMLRSVAGLCRKRGVKGAVLHLEECARKHEAASLPDADEYGTLYAALEGALGSLGSGAARRAAMLAIFPEDTSVPLAVAAQLWRAASAADEAADEAVDVHAEVAALEASHLIDVDHARRGLTLIDLHRDYLRCRSKNELGGWHGALLRHCGVRRVGVGAGAETDAYWGDGKRWVYHLCEGGPPAAEAVRPLVVELQLQAKALGPTEGSAIARLVEGAAALRGVDVGFNNFDQLVAVGIVKAAARHDRLACLGLASCKIGARGAAQIAAYLAASTALASLSLEYNVIDPDGVAALGEALGRNRGLTTLNLAEANKSGDDQDDMRGIVAIAGALSVNATLTSLSLGGDFVNVEGARALAGALRVNRALRHLDLSSNRLCGVWSQGVRQMGSYDASGFEALAAAIASAGSLTELDLRSNGLGGRGAQATADMIVADAALTRCDVRGNSLEPAAKQMLTEAAKGGGCRLEL